MRLSLVIPCYNEAENLPLLIERCREVFAGRDDCEVVLVDNGSTDSSAEVLRERLAADGAVRSVRVAVNEGYGHGILEGLRASRGEILAWTHADMQTDPGDALRGLALFEQDEQPRTLFVKGRRRRRPLADSFFTQGMSFFETVLMRTPLVDINAQPTIFSREFFREWIEPPKDFSLDLFAYYRAKKAGLRVRRFDVRFGDRAHGVSHWNISPAAKLKFIRRTVSFSLALARGRAAR